MDNFNMDNYLNISSFVNLKPVFSDNFVSNQFGT